MIKIPAKIIKEELQTEPCSKCGSSILLRQGVTNNNSWRQLKCMSCNWMCWLPKNDPDEQDEKKLDYAMDEMANKLDAQNNN